VKTGKLLFAYSGSSREKDDMLSAKIFLSCLPVLNVFGIGLPSRREHRGVCAGDASSPPDLKRC